MVERTFRVSSGLKDLIGRELITDDFVAVFELVKNSFDAHAKRVRILFEDDRIVIGDNGKGMDRHAINDKWLFVAYSAKRDGTEDDDFRNRIGSSRPFAGAKGVGRFSCDRLGSTLKLSSHAADQKTVQVLQINWKDYEIDPQQEFDTVNVQLSYTHDFPDPSLKPKGETGTILEIGNLRSTWDRERLIKLKRELTKLIDPFEEGGAAFQIEIVAPAELEADREAKRFNASMDDEATAKDVVNGLVRNPILDVLRERTTSISIELTGDGENLETRLEDRGELIYRISEPNPFEALRESGLKADIYFLNLSAKLVFARRMGLNSVAFGSVFLFRNGFRVSPIGAEEDDYFGLQRRKQQGQRRFLGTRDVIGRVRIKGVQGFEEATSRNQGLIESPQVAALKKCVIEKCIRRLERYVVDISWKDSFDKEVADTSRMRLDDSSAKVSQLVSRLAQTPGVELLDYNPEIVRIVDEKSQAFETSLKALELLADETGDKKLLARVDQAKERLKALEEAELEARAAQARAEQRAVIAETNAALVEVQYKDERERNAFLVAAGSLDQDTILNLHHQIIIHASDVQHDIKRMMGKLRGGSSIPREELLNFFERVSFRNSQILTAARFATKSGYKQQSAEVKADLAGYIKDYIELVSTLWSPQGLELVVRSDGKSLVRTFRPIEVGIVIDNLVSNASKARAQKMVFDLSVTKSAKSTLTVSVADNGVGWHESIKPLETAFDKGVTSTKGSGLGLFHVKQVVESLHGTVEAVASAYSAEFGGAHLLLRFSS